MVDEQTQASFSEEGPIFLIYLLHWFRRTVAKKDLLARHFRPFVRSCSCVRWKITSRCYLSVAQIKLQQCRVVSDWVPSPAELG
jgi:hypothetical protein